MVSEAFQRWRRTGFHFTHHDHPIFVQKTGGDEDPAILCIHGYPTASWDFHRLWPELSAHRGPVLAADMIGFGWSAKPRHHRYSIFDQADLQERLLREAGVTRYRLLAHDYGVTVAQELLARHEQRRRQGDSSLLLESVCLLNGGLFPESHRPVLMQRLLRGPLGPLLARLSNERAFARSFAPVFGPRTRPSDEELAEFWRLICHAGGRLLMPLLLHYIPERIAHRERWVGALVSTAVPLRVINGPQDPVSGAHMVARCRELVPRASIVSLPEVGHYPHVEAPDAVWAACRELLLG